MGTKHHAPSAGNRAGTRQEVRSRVDVDIVTGVCPHDCPDSCAWQVAVDKGSGRALDLWGHAEHPLTRGALCAKVDRYLERTYHPDRLTQPLRRVGAKGEGKFEPISWSEAFEWAAEELTRVIETHGPESVLPYSYAGTMGLLQGEGVASRLFNRMGASRLARTICAEAGLAGYGYTLGDHVGIDPLEIEHARSIYIWGSNSLTSNLHFWRIVQAAQREGARVVVIDPIRTATAKKACQWLGITPGTDAALALSMMHVIIAEELYDPDYVRQYTVGFRELCGRVQAWTPERAAAITGLEAEVIVELARNYARCPAPAIRINYGLQRHAGGGMAVRTIACLPALVGAWKARGGGILLSTSGLMPLDKRSLECPELAQLAPKSRLTGGPRILNMSRLADALAPDSERLAAAHHRPRPVDHPPAAAEVGPPVHALIVYNSNPAAVAPDQAGVLEGLRREDLFTVVLEHFQTDTADFADLILPATTQLEHWDLLRPYGHLYFMLNRPAIAPVGESRANSEIFRGLAAALGYDEPAFHGDDEGDLRAFIAAQKAPAMADVHWQKLLDDGFVRTGGNLPQIPFAEGGFSTPSGKCEFLSARCEADGYDPLPDFIPPRHCQPEARRGAGVRPPVDRAGLFTCLSVPAHNFLNSSFVNVDRLRKREGEPKVRMHSQDAAELGLATGDLLRLSSERGALRLPLQITEDLCRGVVAVPSIWWRRFTRDGASANRLVHQGETDMGGGPIFYDLSVWICLDAELSEDPNQAQA